jgi:glyoxylase-like metal-dependent hydrolase (beta-lactamase superfamily II)
MTVARRVADGVHRIETTVTGTDMPLALHLIEGDAWLVTDTGCVGMMRDLALPAAHDLRPGSRIDRAVVSHAHADHFGGNAELLEAHPGCRIYAHRDDLAWARQPAWHVRDAYGALGADYPCPPEIAAWVAGLLGPPAPVAPLDAGERLELDDGRALRVIHLPGHSPGHVGLWEPETRLLILSDALLADGQRVHGRVVAIPAYLDVDAYLGSIRTVRALAPDTSLPAHFPAMDGDATQTFCDDSEAFVRRLDEAIRSHLDAAERPTTLRETTAAVVPAVAPTADVTMVAAMSVQAHLDALARRGLARWSMAGDERAWSPT